MTLDRGTVVVVELDPNVGREQRGVPPCVAVSDPSVNAAQRFPLIAPQCLDGVCPQLRSRTFKARQDVFLAVIDTSTQS